MKLIDFATRPSPTVDDVVQYSEELLDEFQNRDRRVEEVVDPNVISRLLALDED